MWFRGKSSKQGKQPASGKPGTRSVGHTLQRMRVPVDLLRPGMRVVKLDRPWTEVPVLFQGFELAHEDQFRILRHYCEWVLVEGDEHQLADALDRIARQKKRTTEPLSETRSLERELPRASQAWETTRSFVEKVSSDIETGNALNLEEARPVIRACVASIKSNASAMFWMSRIKSRDEYTAEHCLRVAVFAVAFARFIGLPDEDLEVAGLCGLLHDVGKLKVPPEILNKPGPLDPKEAKVMQGHTSIGYNLLKTDQNLDPIVIDVTRHHHERMDGRGYPARLEEWQISRFSRLIAIVDAYDAMTSDRCYRDGLPASDAMRILYRNRGQQFDAGMVEAFIRMVGIYPPGSLVELSSGEVALVLTTHPGKKLRPKVEILLSREKHPVTPRVIDLGGESNDDAIQITRPLPDGSHGVSLEGRISQVIAGDRTLAQ
ncbi:HD-GYP domain-containing protein [Marinobacter sp.]|uniref:HD-GYP domain-containing protein n=1 Tax=Marinobacter sp. TaxID=50741 RepID=UPI0019BDC170|nr:HD-GYP domain-containing protein [Marinobacter sp.]MBC7191090.1 HD-GYP domain-containing protein [Marinobacter sp.]